MSQFSELARAMKSRGSWVTSSLWDSHTSNRFGRPSKRMSGWWTSTMDLPNSGTLAGAASPPRCFAMNWCPAQIPRMGASNESRYSPFRPIFPGSTPTRGGPAGTPDPSRPFPLEPLRVVGTFLVRGGGVFQAPPLAVRPLAPVVDDVDAHGTPVAAR